MTQTTQQSAYLSALDVAREELAQISVKFNWLLARQKNLTHAAETLEAFLNSSVFSEPGTPAMSTFQSVASQPAEPRMQAPVPAAPRMETPVEPAPLPRTVVEEEPNDPIYRRIHGVLNLA